MATAEELSAAVRQVAAHEAHIETLAARIDEIANHLDQAGARLHAAETQLNACGNSIREVHTQQGDKCLKAFNDTDRMKFPDLEFEMSNFLSAGDNEHAETPAVDRAGTGGCSRGQV